jgi:hypothetical protein
MDDIFTAMTSLDLALRIDPDLEDTAKMDGDMMDVIDLLMPVEEGVVY